MQSLASPVYKEVEKRTNKGYELLIDHMGTKHWYLNGERHREGGPACVWPDGEKEWCIDGELHREDGPAMVYPDGRKHWYLNDREVSEEAFNEVWNCPMGRLPLYINTVFAPIVRRRLIMGK